MTKEDLIQSYIEATTRVYTPEPFYHAVMIVGGLLSMVIVVGIFAYNKKKDLSRKVHVAGIITFLGGFFLLMGGLALSAKTSYAKITPKFTNELEWKSEVFYGQYIKQLPTENIEVIEYKLTTNGGVVAILNTPHELSIIRNINNIKQADTDKPYVETKWFEGISEINQYEAYYETVLYLPRED